MNIRTAIRVWLRVYGIWRPHDSEALCVECELQLSSSGMAFIAI